MKLSVSVEGDIVAGLLRLMRPAAYAAANNAGRKAVFYIEKALGPYPPRTGKRYPSRSGRRRMAFTLTRSAGNKRVGRSVLVWYTASAPGEAPAQDTAAYRKSWSYRVVRRGFSFDAEIYSTLWDTFGRRLEFGGADSRGIYIAPRPHVRPALEKVKSANLLSMGGIPADAWSA